ncbi:MAG: dihydroneopterin aldolase family protein [Candidatus Thermoplasmatota archaeon]|jgi:hypothetical protein|nr:dihydroneopterin aldolase family protein [Candidatus Thermoplasmatota archaeon]
MQDPASKFFNCTDKERAIFEAGIKLGTVYHQYVGVPLNLSNVESLEKAIRESVLVQPFVEEAEVSIDKARLKKKPGKYKYYTLTGDMLTVEIVVKYNEESVRASLRYVQEMGYPLMFFQR